MGVYACHFLVHVLGSFGTTNVVVHNGFTFGADIGIGIGNRGIVTVVL